MRTPETPRTPGRRPPAARDLLRPARGGSPSRTVGTTPRTSPAALANGRASPVLSADTTQQSWSSKMLYSPAVVHVDGAFKMWYVGSEGDYAAEHGVLNIGYGIRGRRSVAGVCRQPHSSRRTSPSQRTSRRRSFSSTKRNASTRCGSSVCTSMTRGWIRCWATPPSSDGIEWSIHPEPIYWSGRSPSVIKEGPDRYRMWMNSRPSPEDGRHGLVWLYL